MAQVNWNHTSSGLGNSGGTGSRCGSSGGRGRASLLGSRRAHRETLHDDIQVFIETAAIDGLLKQGLGPGFVCLVYPALDGCHRDVEDSRNAAYEWFLATVLRLSALGGWCVIGVSESYLEMNKRSNAIHQLLVRKGLSHVRQIAEPRRNNDMLGRDRRRTDGDKLE